MQYLTDKKGNRYTIVKITDPNKIPKEIVVAYATTFWADAWKELLKICNEDGETLDQYGTCNPTTGEIYPETKEILKHNNIDTNNDQNWAMTLWEKASKGKLRHPNGRCLHPFWTIQDAKDALVSFLDDPFYGTILALQDDCGTCIAFTAYSICSGDVANRRFPEYDRCYFPNQFCGTFLDLAVSENYRGRGISSRLFDARLEMMIQDQAEYIVGQTIKTQAAQFYGNYRKRGLTVKTVHYKDPNKCLFVTHVAQITPR